MRVLEEEVENRKELEETVENLPESYSIAAEALLFDRQMKWVLMKRGPECRDEVGKLEGIGGEVEDQDDSFREAVRREIEEEVGEKAGIEIVDFFEVRKDVPDSGETWLVVSFICILNSGELRVMEPGKNEGFHRVDVEEIDPGKLSSSAKSARESLLEGREKVESKLKKN